MPLILRPTPLAEAVVAGKTSFYPCLSREILVMRGWRIAGTPRLRKSDFTANRVADYTRMVGRLRFFDVVVKLIL